MYPVTKRTKGKKRISWKVGFRQRRLQHLEMHKRRREKPGINVVTIDAIRVRGKRRQELELLSKYLNIFQQANTDCQIVRTRESVRNALRSSRQEHFQSQSQSQSPSPSNISPPNTVDNTLTTQPAQSFGLGPFLQHDIPGRLDYICRMLLTAETSWGPINHWAFSFKRRWRDAVQREDIEYAVSKGRTLVELGRRGMVLMVHMMDGVEGNGRLEEYRWLWMEASRLSGTIYEGCQRRIKDQVRLEPLSRIT